MENRFLVKKVINAEEIEIEPNWAFQGHTGKSVIVFGYQTPQQGMYGYEFAAKKLKALLEGKHVELFSPTFFPKYFGTTKLVCRVYLDGTDISNFFPEFKGRQPGFLKGFDDEWKG